jgi:hypothetical protein
LPTGDEGQGTSAMKIKENFHGIPWSNHLGKTEPIFEGSLDVKLPTIWTDEKHRWEQSEKRKAE